MSDKPISTTSSPWIQSPGLDLTFYLATPIFVIPLLLAFLSNSTPERLALITTSFFGLGHHLPSFFRAYGDRILFQEYRWRFILGPLILVPLATWFIFHEMKGYYFLILLWIAWHSASQVFGIGRIYDAKIGKTQAINSWLDWSLIIFGFYVIILFSPWRLGGYLAVFYMTGGPYLSHGFIETMKATVLVVGAIFLVYYFYHYFSSRRLFPLTNHLKLFLYATNLSMWFLAFIWVKNVVVGLCIWEIVHFLQVMPLTWKFCNYRAKNIKGIGPLMTTLFSGKPHWTLAYASLILAYGSLAMVPNFIDNDFIYRLGTAVLVSSGICHFYFEGFIWRVRDRSVQSALGIKNQAGPLRWKYQHAILWSLFAIALVWMSYGQYKSTRTPFDIYKQITEANPRCWYSQYNFAVELEDRGEFDQAIDHYRAALAVNPKYPNAHIFLAKLLLGREEYAEAHDHLQAALDLDARLPLANHYMGDVLFRTGKPEEATAYYLKSIDLDPNVPWSMNNLGFLFMEQNNLSKAEHYLTQALQLDSEYIPSKLNIAGLYVRENKYDEAKEQTEAVLKLQPDEPVALEGISHILQNNQDVTKRDSTLALAYASRLHATQAPQDPVKIEKDRKHTGSYRKPENMKIL